MAQGPDCRCLSKTGYRCPYTLPQGRVLLDDVLTSSYQETLQNAAEVHRFGQSIPDQMRAEQFARTGGDFDLYDDPHGGL